MFKKILIAAVLIAVIGVLTYGAIYRTQAISESHRENTGQGGYGRNRSDVISSDQTSAIHNLENDSTGRGQGGGDVARRGGKGGGGGGWKAGGKGRGGQS
jgi:hypothetical protein